MSAPGTADFLTMSELAGQILGDFHIEALLGKGSMANVYRAWQVSLRRVVALKVLKDEVFTPGDKVRRFLREAEALARLEHAHIVPIYAAGEEAPYYFFAMRLIRGGTLAEAMTQAIARDVALRWMRQVCEALAYAHDAGVVHRDLKPSNILLQDGAAFLGDFGLARLRDLSTMTQSGLVLGTPLYMSPEQTRGEPVTAAADCFALAIIVYQLITGKHPFADTTAVRPRRHAELFRLLQKAEYVPPSAVRPEAGADLDEILRKALERRPEDRFAHAGEILNALDAHGDGLQTVPAAALPLPPAPAAPPPTVYLGPGPAADSAADADGMGSHLPGSAGIDDSSAAPAVQFNFGRYEVLREIGHGGQGIVYEARDPLLDRRVALKVLQGGWKADARLLELFRNEARIAARLNHPHIIPILDFGLEEESPYLTMPLIDGPSLDATIGTGRPAAPGFALDVIAQTADALAFAHEDGVIHLDIKPGNILLRRARRRRAAAPGPPHGHVLLCDFTMARLLTGVAQGGPLSGTAAYAAPEQVTGELGPPGPASDVFSLGVVLHELLTGQRLFGPTDTTVGQLRLWTMPVAPPSQSARGLPPELDALVLEMLRLRPAERPQSMAEVLERIEAIQGGRRP
jgi:serine/threonine protein kinase